MSNNVRQSYSLLCIVYRYVGILGIFKSQRGNFIACAGYTNYPAGKGFFVFVILIRVNEHVILVCFKCLDLYSITSVRLRHLFCCQIYFSAIHKISTRVFPRGCGLHILPTLISGA